MKTIFASSVVSLVLFSSVASAATYIGSGSVDFSNPAGWNGGSIPTTVTLEGKNVTITDGLTFKDSTINWTIDGLVSVTGGNLVFNNGSGIATPCHTTLDLGENGRLAATEVLNFSQGAQNGSSTFSLSATLTGSAGVWTHRTLITCKNMWNVEAFKSPSTNSYDVKTGVFSFEGYTLSTTVLGVGYEESDLADGFAYLCYDSFSSGQPNSISVVFKGKGAIPEPTTATLSLLALASLLGRRRRA